MFSVLEFLLAIGLALMIGGCIGASTKRIDKLNCVCETQTEEIVWTN